MAVMTPEMDNWVSRNRGGREGTEGHRQAGKFTYTTKSMVFGTWRNKKHLLLIMRGIMLKESEPVPVTTLPVLPAASLTVIMELCADSVICRSQKTAFPVALSLVGPHPMLFHAFPNLCALSLNF